MRKFKRSVAAFFLSLWIPGLGQVFNTQIFLGAILFLVYLLSFISARAFHLVLSFHSLIVYALASWTFLLTVAAQAARTAVRQVSANNVQKLRWPSYAVGAVFVCTSIFMFSSENFPARILGVRAFKISSDSMSPTILNGDRIVFDIRYYNVNRPKRGDLVAYLMPQFNVLYVKRIIAVGGDTIATDSQGTILNGKRISEPYVYLDDAGPDENAAKFGPITIPTNQVFVMGDNRNHSYDSRYTGTVGVDHVIGRALYIYYSSGRLDRIGRTVN
jgi:signal peptidase I